MRTGEEGGTAGDAAADAIGSEEGSADWAEATGWCMVGSVMLVTALLSSDTTARWVMERGKHLTSEEHRRRVVSGGTNGGGWCPLSTHCVGDATVVGLGVDEALARPEAQLQSQPVCGTSSTCSNAALYCSAPMITPASLRPP